MRPIPAPRLGDTHGLLRAINQRERLRLDEFITEFSIEELFPPGLENALGRTRQFVSFARSAGLLNEDRGSVELTEIGKRYVRASDAGAVFDVAPDQAEWLRRQLRERHMTDSIYHGAAIGLSLFASNPPDFRVSLLDFGRALAYLGRAGWDNENTLESQGERYTTFLRDLELIDEESRLTETGTQVEGRADAPDPHVPARPRGPAQPGRRRGGRGGGRGRVGRPRPARGRSSPSRSRPRSPRPGRGAGSRARRRPTTRAAGATGEYEEVRSGATAPVDPSLRRRPPRAAARAAVRHLGDRRARRGDARLLRDQPRAGGRGRRAERRRPDDAGDDLRRPPRRSRAGRRPAPRPRSTRASRSPREGPRPRPATRSPRPTRSPPTRRRWRRATRWRPKWPDGGRDGGEAPVTGPPAAVEAGDPLAAGAAAPESGGSVGGECGRAGERRSAGGRSGCAGERRSVGGEAAAPSRDPSAGRSGCAGGGICGGVRLRRERRSAPGRERTLP